MVKPSGSVIKTLQRAPLPSSGPNAQLTRVLPPLCHWLLSLPPILLSPHSASPFMSPCLCTNLLPTQGLRTFLVWTVHILLSSVPLGKHPSQILLGRSDYTVGHLASHMPRSCWHHTHPGSLGPDTLEGLCDLVSLIYLLGFQVPSKCP